MKRLMCIAVVAASGAGVIGPVHGQCQIINGVQVCAPPEMRARLFMRQRSRIVARNQVAMPMSYTFEPIPEQVCVAGNCATGTTFYAARSGESRQRTFFRYRGSARGR